MRSADGRVIAEMLDGAQDLAAFAEEWNHLFRHGSQEPSTSLEWTNALVRHHVGSRDRLVLVRLRSAGRTIGLIPLVRRTTRVLGQPIELLTPLSELYNTHSGLLVNEPDVRALGAFLDAVFALDFKWDCFRMTKLLEDSPLQEPLEGLLRARGMLHVVRDGLPAYVLDLPTTFDAYLAARSSKFRNFLKRLDRRIHNAGAPRVTVVNRPDMLESAYRSLLAIEANSWKEAHGTAITAVTRQTGFYRDLCAAALDAGRLHLQFLELDGMPVAYNLGYLCDGCYSYLKTSYRADARALSPATYLRARLIESLIADGVNRVDFPGEPYEWEQQWTDTVRWHKVLTVYRGTPKSRVLAALERVRHRGKTGRHLAHIDPRSLRPVRSGEAS
jgi:CelD/BcsL family acetyltransferase involved in cellulose biosynthesis